MPDPTAETPGVVIGARGFKLAAKLKDLTGTPARDFRMVAAANAPTDPVGFLRKLLESEREAQKAAGKVAGKAGGGQGKAPTTGEPIGLGGDREPGEPPERSDTDVQEEARKRIRQAARAGRGRASTILNAVGSTIPNINIGRKTLLGGF
jgi:hypothetical protein